MARHTKEFYGHGKETWKELEHITAKGHDTSQVFGDWLDLMLCAFQRPNKEKQYLEIMGKYKNDEYPQGKRPADYFAKALGQLMMEMQQRQCDILGNIFEQKISFGNNGQFLSPPSVSSLLAQLTFTKGGNSIADSACGSGRLLIEACKENTHAYFFGKDLDSRCAKMCSLNLLFFNLNGTVEHGDTLRATTYAVWKTQRTVLGGTIYQLNEEEVEDYVKRNYQAPVVQAVKHNPEPPPPQASEQSIDKHIQTTESQVSETMEAVQAPEEVTSVETVPESPQPLTETVSSEIELSEGQLAEIRQAQEFGIDPMRFEEQQRLADEAQAEYEDLPLFASQNG